MARDKNRGLTYIRRSTDKQEISLPSQVEWALKMAQQYDVQIDAEPGDLPIMQAAGMHSYKGIRLDDGISGSDLRRPGFLAVIEDAIADRTISHLFVYKRDRFARPGDPMPVVMLEKSLLEAGITLVFSEAVSLPFVKGQGDVLRDIGLLLGYEQGGNELRKHAERVITFQIVLARQGFRTGGNAPYGHGRVLVDASGNILEHLPPGKKVQQPGCHVRVVPTDLFKISVWVRMLDLEAQGWGYKRIANDLNDRGIPSPDAGKARKDKGVKHLVTGKWSQNTVKELLRNPIILGVQRYGRRSEGTIRRLGDDGPRLLEDNDRGANGEGRVIFNEESLQIHRQVGDSQCDKEIWQKVQQQMDERGRSQRGIRRAKDPARYPLASRLIDLTNQCGAPMYGRLNMGRSVYSCGRYMRSSGSQCKSNQVDGEAMLRFTLKTLKQLTERHGNREKLRQKLLQRARLEEGTPATDLVQRELAGLRNRLAENVEAKEIAARRMAREKDDDRYEALASEFDRLGKEQNQLQTAIKDCEARVAERPITTPEQGAEDALALLDDLTHITTTPEARAEINPLLQRLGIWIGLNFGTVVKGKKREVQKLLSGRMTFGNGPLPVPLYGKDHISGGPHGCAAGLPHIAREGIDLAEIKSEPVSKGEMETELAEGETFVSSSATRGHCDPILPVVSRPEGISITKVNRGERI